MNRRAPWLFATVVMAGACKPELATEDWLITSTRIIAVRGDPPETTPGAPATYTALIADPSGNEYTGAIRYGFCNVAKPPGENAIVANACLGASALSPIGEENPIDAATPANACILFGPTASATGSRSADPDVTGGFYQPLRVDLPDESPVFHLARLRCGLGQAPADLATAFADQYQANQNPHIAGLDATIGGRVASLDMVFPRSRVTLTVHVTAADAEQYAYYDVDTATVVRRREALRVAWFVNDGALDTESTSIGEGDSATTTHNTFVAPAHAGSARLWVVLRDSRGGVDVLGRAVTVSETHDGDP